MELAFPAQNSYCNIPEKEYRLALGIAFQLSGCRYCSSCVITINPYSAFSQQVTLYHHTYFYSNLGWTNIIIRPGFFGFSIPATTYGSTIGQRTADEHEPALIRAQTHLNHSVVVKPGKGFIVLYPTSAFFEPSTSSSVSRSSGLSLFLRFARQDRLIS